ncbi:MAG TPA: hypothetical protein VIW24_25580 [Aldersonia sp.]
MIRDPFAGIAPASVPGFVAAQCVVGLGLIVALHPDAAAAADAVVVPHSADHGADPRSSP